MRTIEQKIYALNLHVESAIGDFLLIYSNHPDLKKRVEYLPVYNLLVRAREELAKLND